MIEIHACVYVFLSVAFGLTFPATSACAPFSRLRCRWMAASSCGDVMGIMGVASGKRTKGPKPERNPSPRTNQSNPQQTHHIYTDRLKIKPCR